MEARQARGDVADAREARDAGGRARGGWAGRTETDAVGVERVGE